MSLHDWSDKTLVRHAQSAGEVSGVLAVFYVRYVDWSRTQACRYLNEADAWDVAEEAFYSLWRKIPTIREPYRVRGFLRRIVYRKAVDLVRRRRRFDLRDPCEFDLLQADSRRSEAERCVEGDHEAELWRRVEKCLTQKEFRILFMRIHGEMKGSEIADVENLSNSSVRWYLHRAHKKIKNSKSFSNISRF